MKKTVQYILLLFVSFALYSCSDDVVDDNTPDWASIEAYDDYYFFKKYESPLLTRTLEVETNDDAKHKISNPMLLALVDNEGNEIGPDKAQLYQNGQLSEDNTITVLPGDTEVEIGIKLNKSFAQSGDKTCYWTLKVVENPGYEVVCDYEIDQLAALENVFDTPGQSVKIRITHVANNVKVWTRLILTIVICAIVAYIILVQLFIKRFNVKHLINIFVTVNGQRRGIMGYKAGLKGSREIILTSDIKKKQGFWAMLFKGKKSYVYIQHWPTDIKLTVAFNGAINYYILTHEVIMTPRFDARTRNMILDCTTTNGEFRLEYPMQ